MRHERILIRDDETSYVDTYLVEKEISGRTVTRPALIILPGGAYLYKSYREGELVATQFSAMGYQCFVFAYPTLWKKKYLDESEVEVLNPPAPYPEQVLDTFKVISMVRENAAEYGIDPDQIYLLGFSAGAHVAAATAVNWQNTDYLSRAGISQASLSKPNAVVLSYPMIDAELIRERAEQPLPKEYAFEGPYLMQSVFGTEHPTEAMWEEMYLIDKVTPEVPPFFIWHTFEDEVTPSAQTTRFVQALQDNQVTCEYHLFASGLHGMSLCTPATASYEGNFNYTNAIWPFLADAFLKRLGKRE